MKAFFPYIILLFFAGCTNSSENRKGLDSLLLSEDSVRMQNNIAHALIDLEHITVTNDPDIDFARHMQLYYEAALRGARIEIKEGKNSEVIAIAEDQLKHHEGDIKLFDEYVHDHQPKNIDPGFISELHAELKAQAVIKKPANSFDAQFVKLTIRHHREAIILCRIFLKYGKDQVLLQKAKHIINEHKPEIAGLRNMLDSIK
jgi:uncharacterized protein (DUF305 family)